MPREIDYNWLDRPAELLREALLQLLLDLVGENGHLGPRVSWLA